DENSDASMCCGGCRWSNPNDPLDLPSLTPRSNPASRNTSSSLLANDIVSSPLGLLKTSSSVPAPFPLPVATMLAPLPSTIILVALPTVTLLLPLPSAMLVLPLPTTTVSLPLPRKIVPPLPAPTTVTESLPLPRVI